MIEYKETMDSVTEQDVNYLNASVKAINDHFGREVVSLVSSPSYEDTSVDIYEDCAETWICCTFEEAEMYLKAMKRTLRLKGVDIE